METTLTSPTQAAESGLASAMTAWGRIPSLAAALTDAESIFLVIDPEAGAILHAAPAAAPLVDLLAGSGRADLIRHIVRAFHEDGPPRLARLRLDPRRIAPPVLCWLARGARDCGGPAILVIPTGPMALPRFRSAPAPADPGHVPAPGLDNAVPAADPAAPTRADRFLWRIDAAGVLTTLTGPDGLRGLIGQPWRDLAADGRIAGADAILAAVQARRTFRAEPAILHGSTGPFQVELSGAPMGRGDAAFAGFGGFGLIRSAPPERPAAAAGEVPAGSSPAGPAAEPIPPEPAATDPPRDSASDPAATSLSNDEHAAFREIARALGARYAGDEAGAGVATPKPEGGAIMPFPGSQAMPAEPREAAEAASLRPDPEILAGLPLPTLIHRGDTILAANRRLLDLAGYADLTALVAVGLGRLFRGLPQPEAEDPAARRTAVETAAGQARPVEAIGGSCTWAGQRAICLLLRPIDEADPVDALTAERLARAAQAERLASAEIALDALESGIVSVDGAGRVVALNRAAAVLIGCDPREIVGGSFVGLFDRNSVLAVAESLRGATHSPRSVTLAGKPATLRVSPAQSDGRRVAVLDPMQQEAASEKAPGPAIVEDAPASPARPAPGMALTRLDQAFRDPLTGMIHLAGAMLKEPFGTFGDARYRGCLAEIKASGEAMLERVGELLDLAAVEAGSLRLEPRPLALNDVVAGCVAQLQAEAARGRIVMRTSFSSDLDELEADERSVSRAAHLVIEHAIKRSAAGGQIIVSTGSADRAAIALRVRDTGAGAATRPVNPRGVAEGQGSVEDALGNVEEGLALPRALVEANGGRLRLSARPEDGTLVEIIMPTRRAANG